MCPDAQEVFPDKRQCIVSYVGGKWKNSTIIRLTFIQRDIQNTIGSYNSEQYLFLSDIEQRSTDIELILDTHKEHLQKCLDLWYLLC